ncbi:hypothetical protein ABJX56_002213 [Shigella dysenteriae]|nr:hypothetical protein [Shigella boydii]HBK0597500.1 hypothetical protein [Shigella boydii]
MDEKVFVRLVFSLSLWERAGVRASARTFTLTLTLTLTLSLKGEGTDRAQILRDIFFCLVTEEQKIGLLRLNIAEKKHGRE